MDDVARLLDEGFLVERDGAYFLSDNADVLHPELAQAWRRIREEEIGGELLGYVHEGLLSIEGVNEHGELQFKVTEKGIDEGLG